NVGVGAFRKPSRNRVRSSYRHPLLLTYDRAGLRLGEGIALEIDDVRFATGKLNVRQALDERTHELGLPKHGPRLVDLAPGLMDVLTVHVRELKRAALERGQPLARWLFPSQAGTPLDARNVRRAVARFARKAGLGRVTPHDLRHTFGSTLATEELPQYVQQQMGHASVQITIDTYGSAFRAKPRTGVALLDRGMAEAPVARGGRRSGSKVVATGARRRAGAAQVAEKVSGPRRDRTCDPLIKSRAMMPTATKACRQLPRISRSWLARSWSLSAGVGACSRTEHGQSLAPSLESYRRP